MKLITSLAAACLALSGVARADMIIAPAAGWVFLPPTPVFLFTQGSIPQVQPFTPTATTNTQAVIFYTAPDSNDCTVKVSESPTMLPLVHDVDPALFAGAGVSSGAAGKRAFIVGKRLIAKALDGKNYSLALQTYATHYQSVTCAASLTTGTFVTANIPFGMTYQDIPQLDPAAPGETMHATIDIWDRTQRITDSHTGALIKRVSTPNDNGWWEGAPNNRSGPFMFFGGSTKICANTPSGPVRGVQCSVPSGDGGGGMLYYVDLDTGDSSFLGDMPSPYPTIDPVDGRWYGLDGANLQYQSYVGDYAAVTNGTRAALSPPVIAIANVTAAIHAFDSSFDPSAFSCSPDQFEGIYPIFTCGRGIQDSYGWLAVGDITAGTIIAAMRLDKNANYHWTGIHHTDSMYDAAGVIITTHSLVGTGNGPQVGLGPYVVTVAAATPAGATAITVSGEPDCIPCDPDPLMPIAQAGDKYSFLDGSNDFVNLLTKNSPTSWTISPPTQAHAAGVALRAAFGSLQFPETGRMILACHA